MKKIYRHVYYQNLHQKKLSSAIPTSTSLECVKKISKTQIALSEKEINTNSRRKQTLWHWWRRKKAPRWKYIDLLMREKKKYCGILGVISILNPRVVLSWIADHNDRYASVMHDVITDASHKCTANGSQTTGSHYDHWGSNLLSFGNDGFLRCLASNGSCIPFNLKYWEKTKYINMHFDASCL